MIARLALALLPAAIAAKSLVAPLSSSLKAQGDSVVATVACCGAGKLGSVGAALGVTGDVSMVEAATPIALVNAGGASGADAAAAFCACDVLAFDVRLADLAGRTPHGLRQLQPVLQTVARTHALHPRQKLLLVTVSDFPAGEVDESEVSAMVQAEVDRMVGASLPEGLRSASDLVTLRCVFIPPKASGAYEQGLSSLRESLTSDGAAGYLFAGGACTGPAASALECVHKSSEAHSSGAAEAPPPAEVHAAYRCGLLAEAAARQFQQGVSSLKKSSDALIDTFGETAGALLSDALARFDEETEALGASGPVGAARSALEEQLQRALYSPYRKQLAALQKSALAKFRAKVAALKPSAEVESQLKAMIDEAMGAFDASAKELLPAGSSARWTPAYERKAVRDSMGETARSHVEGLQVQGLYLSKSGHQIPVDFSAHWLGLHPFGRDSRYDPVSVKDEPAYRPSASPMKLRATDGYKINVKTSDPDPAAMVFSDKMMQ